MVWLNLYGLHGCFFIFFWTSQWFFIFEKNQTTAKYIFGPPGSTSENAKCKSPILDHREVHIRMYFPVVLVFSNQIGLVLPGGLHIKRSELALAAKQVAYEAILKAERPSTRNCLSCAVRP